MTIRVLLVLKIIIYRQPPEVFCKKAVLKYFAKFTEKELCWSLFLIKSQAFSPAGLLKRLQHRCFPVYIANFLRTSILKNICQRLLPVNLLL